jgi:hypothetical protein
MKVVRITDQRAADAVARLADDDVSAVRKEEAMAAEQAEVDRLLEDVDRELAACELAEGARLSLDYRDAHPARRVRRRVERKVLRSLPSRLPVAGEGSPNEGEAA